MENQIVMIDINKLHPHEDNPRKDLGDLTEITESVRKNGILQNLTVVPCTGYWHGDYTVIIGHRRLAAAKAAGLNEVPCVIRELSYREQVAMMLAENMQRSDLTVYEQAQGMQMMLDLGETVESVAEKTGFSESTVRRRVKLTQLDADIFRETAEAAKAEGRQIELGDYEKLFKIEDENERNNALKSIGTDKFAAEVREARYREAQTEAKRKLMAALAECAEEIDNVTALKYFAWGNTAGKVREIAARTSSKLYYKMSGYANGADIYREYTDEEKAENAREVEKFMHDAEERAKRQAKRDNLDAIARKMFEFRAGFVRDILSRTVFFDYDKKNAIAEFAAWLLAPNQQWQTNASRDFNRELFCLVTEQDIDADTTPTEVFSAAHTKYTEDALLLAFAYLASSDSERQNCYDADYKWIENERLENIYLMLQALGYSMSDEEQAILYGTHELYTKAEKTEAE